MEQPWAGSPWPCRADCARPSSRPPALVAIDMDMAGATERREPKLAQAGWRLNRAMLPALAQQIRLRNLSGRHPAGPGRLVRAPPRGARPTRCVRRLAPDPVGARLLGFTAGGSGRDPAPQGASAAARAAGRPARRRAGRLAPRRAGLRSGVGRVIGLRAAPRMWWPRWRPTRWRCRPLHSRLGRPLVLRSDPALSACAVGSDRGRVPCLNRPAPFAAPPGRTRNRRPFCSVRCADVDLGRWFTGNYRVPAAPDDEEREPEGA